MDLCLLKFDFLLVVYEQPACGHLKLFAPVASSVVEEGVMLCSEASKREGAKFSSAVSSTVSFISISLSERTVASVACEDDARDVRSTSIVSCSCSGMR